MLEREWSRSWREGGRSTMSLLDQLVDDRGSDIVNLIVDPICGCFDLRRTDICVAVHQELYFVSSEL